ncbi:hypothetical protein E2C01_017142 [Portunus trituberculatus]|uniref:Uncharacterized protein n=1 Tax=Portunus trituberculatus TaxID=210409 RepID=A0A5B7DR45_PORTR|nr:hypothetical protein [Portunus trituberculatus]
MRGKEKEIKKKKKKEAHSSAGSIQREKRQPKLWSKCLDTSLVKEDKS